MNMNYFMMLYDSRSINDGAWFEKFSNLAFPDYMFNECIPLKNKIDNKVQNGRYSDTIQKY